MRPMTPAATDRTRHLLGLQGMPRTELVRLLDRVREMGRRAGTSSRLEDTLRGRVIANLFFEDSTRTRVSFTVAAKRLGADAIDLLGSTSSVNKGETLIDTARNIEAMGVSALVVRARQSGAAALIASRVAIPVLNAGDGRHEHPTQGLLDTFTLAEALRRIDGPSRFDLSGVRVAIVGDVNASRVARSAIAAFRTLGAEVVCVGPPGLASKGLEALGCAVSQDLDALLPSLHAVMMLRIQFERHAGAGSGPPLIPGASHAPSSGASATAPIIPSIREYRVRYALTQGRLAAMRPHAFVMHPGPINRGIELDAEVADSPQSLILRQVSNGVLVRMAVLEDLLAGAI
jgi:aspartate carbamoyltransferase catalytic subunit